MFLSVFPPPACRLTFLPRERKGFTLVELAIVLVILGLLVGGVLAGQSLIHAAKLRQTMQLVEGYRTALHAFRDRYLHLPGDLPNASRFWPDTADGNGNRRIEAATSYSADYALDSPDNGHFNGERAQAFMHLSRAGLIAGTYDSTAVLGKGYPAVPLNPTKGMMLAGRWSHTSGNAALARPESMQSSVTLAMIICNPSSFPSSSAHNDCSNMFTPQEAWQMDSKADDGLPHRGTVMAYSQSASCVVAAKDAYNLSASTATCGGLFWQMVP